METHSEGPVNTLIWLSVGLMLYHCLKRRPNIKTTLGRRFLFDRITTVILIVKSSTEKVITVHSKHSRLVQCWAFVFKTGHDLGKCNLNIKSSIYREIERPSQDNLPAFQAYSIHAMNGYQLTCNALTRHSNDMTIKPPPLAFECNQCRIYNK